MWPLDNVVARPWVEIVHNNNNNNIGVNNKDNGSATFDRLGMKSSRVGVPDLEVSHLETHPLTPVPTQEESGLDNNVEHERDQRRRLGSMKKILSPASAEVLARRDNPSLRSRNRMSRRTLQFQSPATQDTSKGDTTNNKDDISRLPRQVRRSVNERNSVRYGHNNNEATSQSEDDRPGAGSDKSTVTVIMKNRNNSR